MKNKKQAVAAAANKPVTNLEMFGYGFGGLSNNLLSMIVASYIIYFFTDVAGLSVAAAGTIYMISKVLDAVCDPLLGVLADKTVSRYGRFRPYMMFGSLFAGAAFILLFTTVSFQGPARFLYYLSVYCMWSVGFTLTVLPYQSSVAIVTEDRQRRNMLVTAGKLVSIPAGLVTANVFKIVKGMGDGAKGWQSMIIAFAVIVVAGMWICACSIRRFDTREKAQAATVNKAGKKYKLKDRIHVITSNKALFMLILAFATNNLADTSLSSVQSYYAKYVLEDMSFISRVGNAATVLTIPVFILAPILAKRFAKRDIFKVGTILHVLMPVSLLILNSKAHQDIILPLYVLTKCSGMLCNVMAFMMLPDCVDFGKRMTGIVSAGLVTSTFTFSNKASSALGGFISSLIMDACGYNANGEQTALVLTAIIFCMSVPMIASDIASFIGMVFYPIDERKQGRLVEETAA